MYSNLTVVQDDDNVILLYFKFSHKLDINFITFLVTEVAKLQNFKKICT